MNGGVGTEPDIARLDLNDNNEPMPSSPPQMPRDDYYRDITTEFFEESEKLAVGQLVQDSTFTLLQAVGALEIMDPKMDSGLLEAEYESFDATKARLPEEILGIMDRLLCHEMAWHLGAALAQTLFTCLYIDKILSSRPTRLEDATFGKPTDNGGFGLELVEKLLRPYCIALIKGCGCINRQILCEHIYEEEDFITQAYGLRMLENVETILVIQELDASLTWLADHEGELGENMYQALRARVMLRKGLLVDLAKDGDSYRSQRPTEWNTTLGLIPELESTHSLGSPADEAWSTSVQRKLASQVPPRPIVDIPFSDAMAALKQLCDNVMDITKILRYESASNLMTYFTNFMTRKETPLPYTRSLIQSIFMKNGLVLGRIQVDELLTDDLNELCSPMEELFDPRNRIAEAPHSAKYQIAKRMDWFMDRAGKSYVEIYRLFLQNRSRLRRNLCRTILDWDSFQVEAEDVDAQLAKLTNEVPVLHDGLGMYSSLLSSWVYYTKLVQMEWIHLLGFELDIYQPHEFAGMYWSLRHYLMTRIGHLERIRSFVHPRPNAQDQFKHTMSLLNLRLLEATAMQDLSHALTNLYTILARLALITPPPQPFGTDHLRYELRMKPFLAIGCPPVLGFDDFTAEVAQDDLDTRSILDGAIAAINEAKREFAQLAKLDPGVARARLCGDVYRANMNAMLRSCFGVSVALGVVDREMRDGNIAEVTASERWRVEVQREGFHRSFPVPSVKSVKMDGK